MFGILIGYECGSVKFQSSAEISEVPQIEPIVPASIGVTQRNHQEWKGDQPKCNGGPGVSGWQGGPPSRYYQFCIELCFQYNCQPH
jgi:hypothetical protein